MYADFNYYQTEYLGDVIESAGDFNRYSRKAAKRIDSLTGGKLRFAFPVDEYAVNAVKDCECEIADFICTLDGYTRLAMENMGTVAQDDGTVRGKTVTSVSSGSESISYSANAIANTEIAEAAKDSKVAENAMACIVRSGLAYIMDANGVALLYAGIPYPCSTEVVNMPPVYPKDEIIQPDKSVESGSSEGGDNGD